MKRIAVCLLTVVMILTLTGCGGGKAKEIDLNALAGDLTASAAFTVDMTQYTTPDGVAAGIYRYEAADVESAVLYYSGSTGEEIFLAKAKDSAAADRLEQACKDRVTSQQASLENYVPEAIVRLQNAVSVKEANYVILVVADDAAAARSIVDGYLK